ncbi:MAG: hypothetical protein J6T74_05765 [Clostridia bacterium]|nr:hypothetical protein [Clostridia bacterium]
MDKDKLELECPVCGGLVDAEKHGILPDVWGGGCRSCGRNRYYDIEKSNGHTTVTPWEFKYKNSKNERLN